MLAKCEDTIYTYYSCGEQYWTKWNAVIKQAVWSLGYSVLFTMYIVNPNM